MSLTFQHIKSRPAELAALNAIDQSLGVDQLAARRSDSANISSSVA